MAGVPEGVSRGPIEWGLLLRPEALLANGARARQNCCVGVPIACGVVLQRP